MSRKSKQSFTPSEEQQALLPNVSGNKINGVGEDKVRRPSPVYWHKPDTIAHGAAQAWMTKRFNAVDELAGAYADRSARGPRELNPPAQEVVTNPPERWSTLARMEALEAGADLVGFTNLDPDWVFENHPMDRQLPNLVILGAAMDFELFSAAPSSDEDPRSALEVADTYNRSARIAANVANWIRNHGYDAEHHAGPWAGPIALTPAAIAAGLGELGAHGNLINDELGSSFRLSAVTTNMPFAMDAPRRFGADEFCSRCQVCTNACPAGAISNTKQMVRGVEKYYVDFDKCVPYFNETHGCGICLAVCPWSKPGRAAKLAEKFAVRRVGAANQ
ncbi:MAG: 4Fe-4S dicluster domain-containing protein [Pseudomonadota bacterium]